MTETRSALRSALLPSPLKVVYIDAVDVDWNDPGSTVKAAVDAGFNVVNLAFYLSTKGPWDMALAWQGMGAAAQQEVAAYARDHGALLLVSAGGSTDYPYAQPAATYGTAVAKWAVSNNLHGVDFDLEGLGPGFTYPGMTDVQVVQWLVNATIAARKVLGAERVISHAPQAPYFGPIGGSSWAGPTGGYMGVYKDAATIDFFNVQFYNHGQTAYTDYSTLFLSCPSFPGTAVDELAKDGVPLSAVVVGKPMEPSDADTGYVAPSDLHQFFTQAAKDIAWSTGVMTWQWHSAVGPSWIQTVYPPSRARTSRRGKRPPRLSAASPPMRVDLVGHAGQGPTQRIRPILGGIQIAGPRANGTLGVVLYNAANRLGLLTAGHVVGAPGTAVGQPDTANRVAQIMVNGYPEAGIDVAFAPLDDGVTFTAYGVFGTLVDYEITALRDWPEQDEDVTMQGAASGATNGRQGQELEGVSVATYASTPGDSGAPVMHIHEDDVILLGIHGGRVVIEGVAYSWFTPVATIGSLIPL